MKPRTILLLAVTAIVTAFVILNWAAFIAPATLSLGFREVEAPLGLLMLGLTVIIGLMLIVYAAFLRNAALVQAGRMGEELAAQRRLADEAEASRFTELRRYLVDEFKSLTGSDATFRADVRTRLDALEHELHAVNHPVPELTGEVAASPLSER